MTLTKPEVCPCSCGSSWTKQEDKTWRHDGLVRDGEHHAHGHIFQLNGPDSLDAYCQVCFMSRRDLTEDGSSAT